MTEVCNLPLPVSIFLWSIAGMMFVTLLIILLVFISMAMEDARIVDVSGTGKIRSGNNARPIRRRNEMPRMCQGM